jgi:RNA polymerase sigma factor (TIGR02999 family)
MLPQQSEVTKLLRAWGQGDQAAFARLVPPVYDELHRLAASYLRRQRPGNTLSPTTLIHEAYLRLVDQQDPHFESRAQFFGLAARVIRGILVDYVRRRLACKRGGGASRLTLDEAVEVPDGRGVDLVALDDALSSLATLDPQRSQVVELRYFGGLTIEETAEFLGVSPATVKREWKAAQAWLYREINRGTGN